MCLEGCPVSEERKLVESLTQRVLHKVQKAEGKLPDLARRARG